MQCLSAEAVACFPLLTPLRITSNSRMCVASCDSSQSKQKISNMFADQLTGSLFIDRGGHLTVSSWSRDRRLHRSVTHSNICPSLLSQRACGIMNCILASALNNRIEKQSTGSFLVSDQDIINKLFQTRHKTLYIIERQETMNCGITSNAAITPP